MLAPRLRGLTMVCSKCINYNNQLQMRGLTQECRSDHTCISMIGRVADVSLSSQPTVTAWRTPTESYQGYRILTVSYVPSKGNRRSLQGSSMYAVQSAVHRQILLQTIPKIL